ncbi:hypothetical protein LJR034_009110 [Caballeronia sp. LjRoot34]|uniref:hypothetical protein n=1 Tax=Caballeronia sp. LjRoot34 TaxID=3342325 RepID=UPI0011C372EA
MNADSIVKEMDQKWDLFYNGFISAIKTDKGVALGIIVLAAALVYLLLKIKPSLGQIVVVIVFIAAGGYVFTVLEITTVQQAIKIAQPPSPEKSKTLPERTATPPSTAASAPASNSASIPAPNPTSVPASGTEGREPEERLFTSPTVRAASKGDNEEVRQCFTPEPGWRFVPESASVQVTVNVQNEGLAGVSIAKIDEASATRVCLSLVSRPSTSYSRATIEAHFDALMRQNHNE